MLALFNYIDCKSNLLITTDVTSRGINFGKEIDSIISFDMGDREE
jgi:superfamily II DNA/RNA helicase